MCTKRFMVSLCVILMGMAARTGHSRQSSEKVSVSQCYVWARDNYPQVKQFGLIAQTEQYSLANISKAWLPQLSINAQATYQSEVTKLPFDADAVSSIIPGFDVPVVSKGQYKATAELNQAVWDGGVTASSRSLARAEAKVSREQLEKELYLLNERVNQLFFGCLLQEELIRQNRILQKDLQVNIERVEAMMANGTANISDKESLQAELLKVRQQSIGLEAAHEEYLRMLSILTGHSLENAELLIPQVAGKPSDSEINRPELRYLDAQMNLADTKNKMLNAGLTPRIGAFIQGGYGRPGLNMLDDSFNPFYIAGIRLSWNLGNFYTLKDNRRALNTNRQHIELQREIFLFNTRLQLISQDSEIRKMADIMQSDKELTRLRTNIRKAAEVKLENGMIAVPDLIREINAEDLARRSEAVHHIQYISAIYNYKHTINNE